jgi:hypothetical protein
MLGFWFSESENPLILQQIRSSSGSETKNPAGMGGASSGRVAQMSAGGTPDIKRFGPGCQRKNAVFSDAEALPAVPVRNGEKLHEFHATEKLCPSFTWPGP